MPFRFFRLGPLEIGIVLVIILIIFGVGKLPQVGEALGKGIRGFRKASSGEDEQEEEKKEEATKALSEEAPKEAEKPEVSEAKAKEKKESPSEGEKKL